MIASNEIPANRRVDFDTTVDGDGAHREGDEREVQGNLGRRPGRSPGALLERPRMSLGREQRRQAARRVAGHGGLLLLSVHAAIGAGRDDAADVRGVRPERHGRGRRWSASSTTATRRSVSSPASRWIGSGRARWCRSVPRRSASARLLFASGEHEAASIGRLLQGAGGVFALDRRRVHRDDELSGVARGDADRRDADVRHGRRLGGPVRRRADHRRRRVRGPRSGSGWASRGLVDQRAAVPVHSCPRRSRVARRDDWLKAAGSALGRRVPQSAVDPVRHHRRAAVHPHDDLRHDLGRPLPAGGARRRLRHRRAALGDGARRVDHRLPAARLAVGSHRPAQAGDHRRRQSSCSLRSPGFSTGRADVFPPYVLGLVAGIASGAAMLPYTVIKEANPPELSGTATGVVNFLNFTFSALLDTGVRLGCWCASPAGSPQMQLEHYQTAFEPLLLGVALAILLTFFLKETGPAVQLKRPAPERGNHGTTNRNRQVRGAAHEVRQPRSSADGGRASLRGDGARRAPWRPPKWD